jgi:aminoglycoside phosphotransferase (APT) family kinase protein
VTLAVQRDLDDLRAGLARWRGRPVGTIERPDPGWSCETVIVDGELVVRLPPLGDGIFPVYDLALQASVQEAVGAAGVPVASPVTYEPDPSFLGAPFVAMPFVAGAIPGAFTPADPWLASVDAATVWRTFLGTVASVHAVAPPAGLRRGLDAEVRWWSDYVDWAMDGDPPAALRDALAWCADHRPEAEPDPVLLWGDVRLGNVIFAAAAAVAAVLDWDMVTVGPPEMDVAWFTALEAMTSELSGMSVAGFGTPAEAAALVLGREPVAYEWFEVFALVRASAVSNRIATLFARAGQRSMFRVGEDPTLAAALARITSLG